MMLAPARVQPPKARIHTWGGSYTFHAISEPVHGAIPAFQVDARFPERKAA